PGGAGPDAAKAGSHDALDPSSRAVGQGGVAASALFDDALEQARYEGDATRLYGLQIARREEPRARGVARALDAVGDERIDARHDGRAPGGRPQLARRGERYE